MTYVSLFRKNPTDGIITYTDGSTAAKLKLPNSGASLHVTDTKNQVLWSGGLTVRSDGNNFIPELAAAAIIIKPLPQSLPLILRMDSTAAISAISKGALSERKRICAAGRPWLNFCRKDFLDKSSRIKIEHVSSHMGDETPEQIGNNTADRIDCERLSPYR